MGRGAAGVRDFVGFGTRGVSTELDSVPLRHDGWVGMLDFISGGRQGQSLGQPLGIGG